MMTKYYEVIKTKVGSAYSRMRGERGKVWQKRFFDYIIDDEVDLKEKIRYIL
ncbi:MAG: hypothetical protein ACETWT_11875 [Thermodesulfobacteriota bacterium]